MERLAGLCPCDHGAHAGPFAPAAEPEWIGAAPTAAADVFLAGLAWFTCMAPNCGSTISEGSLSARGVRDMLAASGLLLPVREVQ
jgi:hypothetical protein